MPDNSTSGDIFKGLARKYLKINGKREDHIHMVLLNEALEEEEQMGNRKGDLDGC